MRLQLGGCDRERNTYNVFFYYPDGREEFVGQVTGLSACQRAAGGRAAGLGVSGWSYVCCWESGGSSCKGKHR